MTGLDDADVEFIDAGATDELLVDPSDIISGASIADLLATVL